MRGVLSHYNNISLSVTGNIMYSFEVEFAGINVSYVEVLFSVLGLTKRKVFYSTATNTPYNCEVS